MKTLRYIVAIVILAAGAGCNRKADIEAMRHACISNMLQMEVAKGVWAKEQNKTTNDLVTTADIERYLNPHTACPEGGTYTLGRVGERPTCSIKGHVLPKPMGN